MQDTYTPEEGFIDRSSVDRRSGRDRRLQSKGLKGLIERRNFQRRKENRGGPTEVFKFREISSLTDLFWSFRTRYEVYRDVGFIPPNNDGLDIDGYAQRSVHLGAYLVQDGEERMVGTLRHVTWASSPQAEMVRELASQCSEASLRKLQDPPRALPMFESFQMPTHEAAVGLVRGGDRGHAPRPFEVSRLTVLPRHWHKGITRGIHELATLWCWHNQWLHNDAVIATNPNNARKYAAMGFTRVEGTGEIVYKGLNQPAVALELDVKGAYDGHPYYVPCTTIAPFFEEHGFFFARH